MNAAKSRLERFGEKIVCHLEPFSNLGKELAPEALGGVLYDLGVSSHQIDSGRGFSFAGNEPLDMRMDASSRKNAQDYLKEVSEENLAKAFRENSDLEKSVRLAKRILSDALHKEKITAVDLNALRLKKFTAIKEKIGTA